MQYLLLHLKVHLKVNPGVTSNQERMMTSSCALVSTKGKQSGFRLPHNRCMTVHSSFVNESVY